MVPRRKPTQKEEERIIKLQHRIDEIEKSNTRDVTLKIGERRFQQIEKLLEKIRRLETCTKIVEIDGKRYLIDA